MSRLSQRCYHFLLLLLTLAQSYGANPSRFVHVMVADNNTHLVALAAVNQVSKPVLYPAKSLAFA